MPYCPHCGGATDQVIPIASPVSEAIDREVEIARIQAERDIEVARITARQDRDWNETRIEVAEVEAEAQVAAAEAEAEVIAAVVEATAEPEPEPEPEPLIIDAPVIDDQVDEDAPPTAEGSPVPEPEKKTRGLGMW